MTIELGFGKTKQPLFVPDANVQEVLEQNKIELETDVTKILQTAFNNPIGTIPLHEIVKKGEKIAIITSDITRPLPTYKILPQLMQELAKAGVEDRDVTVVFALGSHRFHTEDEKKALVGEEMYNRLTCVDGDSRDCVHMGITKHGTPVDIARPVAEAQRRICLGNIEYHYFAGYSGGAKAIMPGVSTRDAIQTNHTMMIEAAACTGNTNHNPVRDDLEEGARICGVDFILNVVLDEHKNIVHAVAGDMIQAHRAGCDFLDTLYQKKITKKADIVVVSQGGYPKDLNLYQTQKALDNAQHAVKDGGIIILVGSCKEGLGEHTFEEWMLTAKKSGDLIERIKREFKLGGHKAAAIAMVLEKAKVFLVSEMDADFVKSIFFTPFATVQSAFDKAFKEKGEHASVLIMPYGGSTLPKVV